MADIAIQCPKCHAQGQVPQSYAGKNVRCECGHSFAVPFEITIEASDTRCMKCGNFIDGAASECPWCNLFIEHSRNHAFSLSPSLIVELEAERTPNRTTSPPVVRTIERTGNRVAAKKPVWGWILLAILCFCLIGISIGPIRQYRRSTPSAPQPGGAPATTQQPGTPQAISPQTAAPQTTVTPQVSVPAPAAASSASVSNDVEVLRWGWENGSYGSRYLTGDVRNNSNRQLNQVSIRFNLYDSSGVQVGNTGDFISNLEPGGTWHFKAYVSEKIAATAKLKGVITF